MPCESHAAPSLLSFQWKEMTVFLCFHAPRSTFSHRLYLLHCLMKFYTQSKHLAPDSTCREHPPIYRGPTHILPATLTLRQSPLSFGFSLSSSCTYFDTGRVDKLYTATSVNAEQGVSDPRWTPGQFSTSVWLLIISWLVVLSNRANLVQNTYCMNWICHYCF